MAEKVQLLNVSTRIAAPLWKRIREFCIKADVTVQAFINDCLDKAITKAAKKSK